MEKKSTAEQILNGRYQLQAHLGSGGMSAVFAAMDLKTGERVAVKRSSGQEVSLLSRLDHPGIVRYLDSFQLDGDVYLVEEYLGGENLSQLVKKNGPFAAEAALQIGLQICDTLKYLHGQNPPVIYRDIKPANIMMPERQRAVLVDFGIAREFTRRADSDTAEFGTPRYAAPEQFGSVISQSDVRSDIYALGKTLYFLLTGVLPEKEFHRQVSETIADKDAAKILLKCTWEDPEKRYQSAEALAYDIELWIRRRYSESDGIRAAEQEAEKRPLKAFKTEKRPFEKRRVSRNPVAVLLNILAILIYAFGFILGVSKAYADFATQIFHPVYALPYWGGAFAAGTLVLGIAQIIKLLHEILLMMKRRT